MSDEKVKVVYNLAGDKIPFVVPKWEETFYVDARDLLNDRMAVLKNKYASSATTNHLLTALAVEALVDALKVNDRYNKLKSEVDTRIDILRDSLSD